MELISQIRYYYNKLLPAHTITLFLSVFMLTIAYQAIQQNHHGTFAIVSSAFNASDDSLDVAAKAQKTASTRNNNAALPAIDRSERKIESSQSAQLQAEQHDDESLSPVSPGTQTDFSSTGNPRTSRPSSQTTPAGIRAQNVYLPGAAGGASVNNTFNNNSTAMADGDVVSTTPANNSTTSSLSSSQSSAVTEQSQQSLLASNEVNNRAQQLYEQRRQRLCQDVISRVGTNPLASDFNSTGEYYRLRDGYRCF